ncbi:CoA transferase subunit A [Brevibacterium marinum]|uniref:3-oxoacid CoA-transferase subunit A n=1 Tax=Brevibacterium marinum TaxID=418643 RepID=A0A846S0R3_9MICO|nr:CoA transferase subunit A [Brevibacterium marinum]NJC57060.1 3-oxoacid CoA-transferase subunit A [Brevibacterium marinum]
MDKVHTSSAEAIGDILAGASIAVGGFGLVGVPVTLIRALRDHGVGDLEVISNNCGVDDWGLGELLSTGQITRMIASYVGENHEFARRYLGGELELEFAPQGTLAERMRCGGAGIPGFYTASGVGTVVADGGLPWRYDSRGNVIVESPAKETRKFDHFGRGLTYVLEEAIVPDFSLVRAAKGDRHGNLVFEKAERSFSPVVATCGRTTIAEVEELVEPGEIDPDEVDVPGIYVHRVIAQTAEVRNELPIEKLRTRPRTAA